MASRVGDYLKHDPLKLRFTSSNPQSGAPKAVIKRALNQSVADITQTNYYSQHPNVIVYYEILDISIVELETKKSLKVVWTGRNNKEEVSCNSVSGKIEADDSGDTLFPPSQDINIHRPFRTTLQAGQTPAWRIGPNSGFRHCLDRTCSERIHGLGNDRQFE